MSMPAMRGEPVGCDVKTDLKDDATKGINITVDSWKCSGIVAVETIELGCCVSNVPTDRRSGRCATLKIRNHRR